MTSNGLRPPILLRFLERLIRVLALVVPRSSKRTWREEWVGEVWHGLGNSHHPESLSMALAFVYGAIKDALWIRRHAPHGRTTATQDGIASWLQDARQATRALLRAPGFSLAISLTFALGIGGATTIFSVLNSVLFQALPYEEADQLVSIMETFGERLQNVSPQNFVDWQDRQSSFEHMTAFSVAGYATVNLSGDPVRVRRALVTPDVFNTLRISPARGRSLALSDGDVEAEPVVVVSSGFWTRRFGADPQMIGKHVPIDGITHRVVGVLAADTRFLDLRSNDFPELWLPLRITSDMGRGGHWLKVIGRLNHGTKLDVATADLKTIARQLELTFPETNTDRSVVVEPLHDSVVESSRAALYVLATGVGLLLLVACINATNLLLARGASRRGEIALRRALGAGNFHVVRHLLAESMVLAMIGGAVGLVATSLAIALIARLGSGIPRSDEVAINVTVLAFAFVVSTLTGLAAGLVPALTASGGDLRQIVRSDRGQHQKIGLVSRLRSGLTVLQVAVAFVLLIGAGLLARSFFALTSVPSGLNPANVVTLEVVVPELGYESRQVVAQFYRDLVERVEAQGGVQSAGAVNNLPFRHNSCDGFVLEDRPPPELGNDFCAYNHLATPGYFRAMGIPIHAGRGFLAADIRSARPVAVVNETFARTFWPNENALGKRIGYNAKSWQIVGVASSVRRLGLDRDPHPELYIPHAQDAWSRQMILVVRTEMAPEPAVVEVRGVLRQLDAGVPVGEVVTMAQLIAATHEAPRFRTAVLTLFGGLALSIATIGIYGVISYSVTHRTHEIGLRMAMGAGARRITMQIIKDGLVLTMAGVTIGFAGGVGAARLMRHLLFGIGPTDTRTFLGVTCLVIVVAMVASFLPTVSAVRLDPSAALRAD